MPRTVPRYRRHKSGQAVVSIDGKDIYLGAHDTLDSRQRYAELVTAYLERKPMLGVMATPRLTVARAIDRFWFGHAHGLEHRERHHYKQALRPLVALFGPKQVADIGPVWFRAVRGEYVKAGWTRQYANAQADRLKRFLRWLVSYEMFDAAKLAAIREVPRLKNGEAPDAGAVVPVSWAAVEATLPRLPTPVARLVLFLWWTGARPGEACRLKWEDVDRSGTLEVPGGEVLPVPGVWSYRPKEHKGTHAGRPRIILIGPLAQGTLSEMDGYQFDPRQVARHPRARDHYTPHALSVAVRRAALAACVPHWHPHQLRHAAGTRFRADSGKDIAATLLGHKGPTVTDRYAVEDWKRAAECVRRVG